MRRLLGLLTSYAVVALGTPGCERRPEQDRGEPAPARSAAPALSTLRPWQPRPIASEVVAVERALQARALRLALISAQEPRLVFGKGVLGRLGKNSLLVHALRDASLVVEAPLDGPRAVVALADGSLLAIGASAMLRVEPGKKPVSLPKPVLLPGVELYADAVQADRIWTFEGRRARPLLASYRLATAAQTQHTLLLPEQAIELEAPSGGVFGTTREGVWLYFAAGKVERFGPGGARLSRLVAPEVATPFLILPTRRLDQSYLLKEDGRLTRALVSPLFRKLSELDLGLVPFAAGVADEGRLLAVVAVVGEGPRFELRLFDEALVPRGRAPLPADSPTGRDDWVQVVTRNLQLACAAREPLVAVGGPDRVLIFDAQGAQVLSIPSQ